MTTTAIVIGAGPAGLAAASHLAAAGADVTVLEGHASPGGRASSEPLGPLRVNRGPHALYQGGAARRELDALGIRLPSWNPVAPLGSFLLTGPGTARRGPGGPRTLAQLGRFATRVLRGASVDPALSVDGWLDAELSDPAARATAAGLVRVSSYVADHAHFRAEAAAAQLRLALAPGVRYLGPWEALVAALADVATGRGARVVPRTAVRALAREGGSWVVRTGDAELRADVVVLAAGGPAAARRILGPDLGAGLPEDVHAGEAASLDLVLRRLPRPRRRFAFGTAEPHYASVHTPKGEGPVLLTVAAYLTAEDRSSGTRERLEAVADLVQPGWRAELLAARHLPRMAAVPLLPAPGGPLPGGRPAVAVPGAPGLALAGDWVGPEGLLLDAALASAAAAARSVLATAAPSAGVAA